MINAKPGFKPVTSFSLISLSHIYQHNNKDPNCLWQLSPGMRENARYVYTLTNNTAIKLQKTPPTAYSLASIIALYPSQPFPSKHNCYHQNTIIIVIVI